MDIMNHTGSVCGILLISHGNLAKGMLDSVRLLLGDQKDLAAYDLRPDQRVEDLTRQLRKEVLRYGEDNLLILSDMQYGSPSNAAVALALEYPQIQHITGMNLSVILAALTARNEFFPGRDLDWICSRVIEETSGSIVDVRRLLSEKLRAEVEVEEED